MKGAYVLLIGWCAVMTFVLNCFQPPGPISVQVNISPSIVESGELIVFTVKVTNSGGKVKITKIHAHEEVIAGWAQGTEADVDLPLSNTEVAAKSTEVVYSQTSPVLNIGPTDITSKMTVTVYSNGGTDTDDCTYTIKRHGTLNIPPALKLQTVLIH